MFAPFSFIICFVAGPNFYNCFQGGGEFLNKVYNCLGEGGANLDRQYGTMRAFMWQADILSVARFVVECLDVLEASASASHQP